MALMIDRLDFKRWGGHVDSETEWLETGAPIEDLLGEHTPAFEITNVADLAYRMEPFSGPRGNIQIDPAKFPNVAPPFRSYWCEWRCPSNLDVRHTIGRFGIWTVITNGTDDEHWELSCGVFCGERKPRPVGYFRMEVTKQGGVITDPGRLTIYVDEAEQLLGVGRSRPDESTDSDHEYKEEFRESLEGLRPEDRAAFAAAEMERLNANVHEADGQLHKTRMQVAGHVGEAMRIGVLPPLLLAHSLLGCKNVETEDHVPNPKLSRASVRRHGRPKTVFKTLTIRPMGGSHAPSERVALGDGQTALHLVRGHFKTFSPERPLLGKHVGTYWWSPNVRGGAEYGTVVKDYEVRA